MLRGTLHGVTVMEMSWGCWYRVSVPCMGLLVPGLVPQAKIWVYGAQIQQRGTLVGKPHGLSCHTPHLGFWHPVFPHLLMETPGWGEGGAPALGSSVGFVCQVSAVIPPTGSPYIQRGLWGAPVSPALLLVPRVWLPSWVTPTRCQHGLSVPGVGDKPFGMALRGSFPTRTSRLEEMWQLQLGCRVGGSDPRVSSGVALVPGIWGTRKTLPAWGKHLKQSPPHPAEHPSLSPGPPRRRRRCCDLHSRQGGPQPAATAAGP